jgi:hypothetical protein
VRLRASVASAAIDVRPFVAALPAVATRWRALRFEDGVVVTDDGTRKEGLAVASGSHPLAGTTYRVALPMTEPKTVDPVDGETRREQMARAWGRGPSPSVSTCLVELAKDDARQVVIRAEDAAGVWVADVDVHHPARPDAADVAVVVHATGGWLTRGPVEVTAHLDVGALRVDVTVRHRHAKGRATLAVDAAVAGEWTSSFDIMGRGRGVLRPVVAVASPFVRGALNRKLASLLRHDGPRVARLNEQIADEFGAPADPEEIAAAVMKELLDAVAEQV